MASFGPELGLRWPPPRYLVHAVTEAGGPLKLIDGDNLEERLAEALSLGWKVLGFSESGSGLRTAYVAERISEEEWQRWYRAKRKERRRQARYRRRLATWQRRKELASTAKELRRMPKRETAELWGLWRGARQEIARIEAFS